MKSNGKYLFDECIGRHVMNQLRELVCADAAEFVHLTDYFREGIPDEEWIPKLGGSAGLILITSDGGRQSKRGSKLPDLCIEYKLTHVVMSPKLHAMKSSDKVGALAIVWRDIESAKDAIPGSQFRLRMKSVRGRVVVVLDPFPEPRELTP